MYVLERMVIVFVQAAGNAVFLVVGAPHNDRLVRIAVENLQSPPDPHAVSPGGFSRYTARAGTWISTNCLGLPGYNGPS